MNTRTTVQFTKQFFVRAIAQYDSLRARVLTDYLANCVRVRSLTWVTVRCMSAATLGDAWISGAGDYLGTRRGFFMKASYLYRF